MRRRLVRMALQPCGRRLTKELVAIVLGKGFEVVEDEQRLRGTEGFEQEPDTLVLRCLREVRLPELASQFIEHLEEARQDEAVEFTHAIVVQLAVFHRHKDDALELAGRAVVGGADGQRGLPMPPGPSMSAPQVRDSGSRASRIVFNSSSRPKKGCRRGRLFGMEVRARLLPPAVPAV